MSTQLGEEWQHIQDPLGFVIATDGMKDLEPKGTHITQKTKKEMETMISKERSEEVNSATPMKNISWSDYSGNGGNGSTKSKSNSDNE